MFILSSKLFFPSLVQRELLISNHNSPRSGGCPGDDVTAETVEDRGRDRPPGQSHTHSLRRNGNIHHPRPGNPDPSCLLTPPNTPLYPDGGGGGGGGHGAIIGLSIQSNGCISRTGTESKKANGLITNGLEGKTTNIGGVDKIKKIRLKWKQLNILGARD